MGQIVIDVSSQRDEVESAMFLQKAAGPVMRQLGGSRQPKAGMIVNG